MKILLIGYSDIFQRKVHPVLVSNELINSIDIATYSKYGSVGNLAKCDHVFNSYSEAIQKTNADIAYITTTNNLHEQYAIECIQAGLHTLIDKPVMLSDDSLEKCLGLAKSNNICLSEVIVWEYHRQIDAMLDLLKKSHAKVKHVRSTFCFPPLMASNFRNFKSFGGGAFFDLSPYFVSVANLFAKGDLINVDAEILEGNSEIDLSITLTCSYSDGLSISGYYSFNSPYINRLEVFSDQLNLSLDRAYTTPETMKNKISLSTAIGNEVMQVEPDDTFKNYFDSIITDIHQGHFSPHWNRIEKNTKLFNTLHNKLRTND